jgi:hypothetical protein
MSGSLPVQVSIDWNAARQPRHQSIFHHSEASPGKQLSRMIIVITFVAY